MVPAEVRKKVKLLEIRTRKLVNNLFSGEYHTAFKGQGMTFSDFREYVPGDDVRTISWALTARAGKPYIKKFDEERELTVILAVDVSASTYFGSGDEMKGELMTHLAALLAFSATKNKDQVGLLLFSDIVEHYVQPKKGRGHVQRLLRDLYFVKPKAKLTKISVAAEHLLAVQKKKSVVFLMSDFFDKGYDISLRALGRKHDVIALVLRDPFEEELPAIGLIELADPETGEVMIVDSESATVRKELTRLTTQRIAERDKMLKRAQVQRIDVSSGPGANYVDPLIKFFANRRRR